AKENPFPTFYAGRMPAFPGGDGRSPCMMFCGALSSNCGEETQGNPEQTIPIIFIYTHDVLTD
ncbi:MAG: hypothetical protein LBS10_11850, partial [Gracilibacteraceae bacterium]|nr:hypothetical protein [Gracilibacteraceae bacterium]